MGMAGGLADVMQLDVSGAQERLMTVLAEGIERDDIADVGGSEPLPVAPIAPFGRSAAISTMLIAMTGYNQSATVRRCARSLESRGHMLDGRWNLCRCRRRNQSIE